MGGSGANHSRRWSLRALVAIAACALGLVLLGGTAQADGGQLVKRYITVDDGTSIAVCIWEPSGFDPNGSTKWPSLFEMDGYGGCGANDDNEFLGHSSKYVVVYAQIRGTGCSGGRFDLFSRRSALDGKFIIDRWIRNQPWSNGRVGITGHSYSGLTGFLVAATHPHVQGVAVSGLIDDFYRSILYPGGVFNEGFPILWGALLRPGSEFSGNTQNYQDPTCLKNQLQHQGSDTVPVQLLAPVYTQTTATPDSWAIQHSLDRVEHGLDAPIQINQQYQDEQTGPRGGYPLWQHVPSGLPKRLVLSNGQHNPNDAAGDKKAWLDCWVIDDGHDCPTITGENASGDTVTTPVNDPSTRVVTYFDSLRGGPAGQQRNTPYLASDWPDPATDWQRYLLRSDHSLGTSADGADGSVSYVSTTTNARTTGTLGILPEQDNVGNLTFTDGPDQARWTLPFDRTTAISGPMLLNLWLKSTAPDTDVFVDVMDRNTKTGEVEYLQRGVMRASFRAIDYPRSDRIQSGPMAGTIYRPYHDYRSSQLMVPGRAYRVPVEIYPAGHVFYPGHELVLDVHAPPANDPISTYAYEPHSAPAVNTILQARGHRSSLLLPVMPTLPPLWPTEPACQDISGYVCFTPGG
jgi:predicted acyl esterase